MEFFDLSYSLSNDTVFYPGQREFSLNRDYDGVNKSGIWYSAFSFCAGEHGGTHIDAPYHFYKDGWTVDQIPPDHLIDVPVTVVDVEDAVNSSLPPGSFSLQTTHLIEHEKRNKAIPSGGVVLVHTGWSKFWPDKIRYLGWSNESTDVSSTNFPGISLNAAKWLSNERNIVGIGIDTPSVDVGNDSTYPVHVFLAKKQIYNIENVANLHTLDPTCSLHLLVLPIKIIGATGAPSRILAYCK